MIIDQYPYFQVSIKFLKNQFTAACTSLLQVMVYWAHCNMASAPTILQN